MQYTRIYLCVYWALSKRLEPQLHVEESTWDTFVKCVNITGLFCRIQSLL